MKVGPRIAKGLLLGSVPLVGSALADLPWLYTLALAIALCPLTLAPAAAAAAVFSLLLGAFELAAAYGEFQYASGNVLALYALILAAVLLAARSWCAPDHERNSRIGAVFLRKALFLGAVLCVVLAFFQPWDPDILATLTLLCAMGWNRLRIQTGLELRIMASLANGAILLFATLSGLLLMEGGARVFLPPSPRENPFSTYHEECLFMLNPGGSGLFHRALTPTLGRRIEVAISREGLRDRVFGPKKPGEYRIALLGDSFTMGTAVQADETISRYMEQCLEGVLDRDVAVMNAGLGGSGPWQQYVLLRDFVLPLEPDLVVWQFYPSNDILNGLEYLDRCPRAYNEYNVHYLDALRRRHWFRHAAEAWLQEHVRVYGAVTARMNYRPVIANAIGAFRLARPAPAPPPSEDRIPELETSLAEWYPELEQGYEAFQELVAKVVHACRREQIPLVAFSIPNRQTVFDFLWFTMVDDQRAYQRYKGVRKVEETLRALGVPHFDVGRTLEQGGEPGEVFYLLDGHLTPYGNALTAQAVARRLVSEHLPNLSAGQGFRLLRETPGCGPLPSPPEVVMRWNPRRGAYEVSDGILANPLPPGEAAPPDTARPRRTLGLGQ